MQACSRAPVRCLSRQKWNCRPPQRQPRRPIPEFALRVRRSACAAPSRERCCPTRPGGRHMVTTALTCTVLAVAAPSGLRFAPVPPGRTTCWVRGAGRRGQPTRRAGDISSAPVTRPRGVPLPVETSPGRVVLHLVRTGCLGGVAHASPVFAGVQGSAALVLVVADCCCSSTGRRTLCGTGGRGMA